MGNPIKSLWKVNVNLLISSFTDLPLAIQEYVELSMSGSAGERSFVDIITLGHS